MLLVGVLWVLPMLALALLFSEGEGLFETGCRLAPEQGHPEERGENKLWEHDNKERTDEKTRKEI